MDAFFEPSDATHPSSPVAHPPSSPPNLSLEDMPPHVTTYSSPNNYSHSEFDAKPFYSPSESFHPAGPFTPPADYTFTSSSAPELSHVDLVHQEIVSAQQSSDSKVVRSAEASATNYWSPDPDVAVHTPTPASNSQANASFLSELYSSEPMTITTSNGVSPAALSNSGPNSPTWSVGEGQSEHKQRQMSSPGYASDGEHHLFRRSSCPNWSTAQSSQQNTPTQQNPHPSRDRDDILPPVSTLLFDHHRSQQSSQSVFDYHRSFEVHTPPESIPSFELRPVIYGSDMGAEPSSFHSRHMDDVYMRSASHDFGSLDYEPKSDSPSLSQVGLVHNVPIMYTDDAASKETQYLRRRCFNCRATEPPSWRRSTLNPGKIVCNKCGLYERTHLRPRPHRFDELRGGSAVTKRKTSKTLITGMPSSGKGLMHKDHALPRRTSMASMTSTASSENNWDDYSVSSTSSTPPFTSPTTMEFPHNVQGNGPITLPQPPLLPRPRSTAVGRKASTSSLRGPWSPPISQFVAPGGPAQQGQASIPRRTLPAPHDYFARRGSFDISTLAAQRRQQQIPVETGWQTIPLEEMRRDPKSKTAPIPIRSVAA